MHINQLSDAEDERLTLLIEESSEVIQAATKIQRHGYESKWLSSETNREHLEKEIGDFLYIMNLMIERHDLNPKTIGEAIDAKADRIGKFLHYQ